MCALGMMLRDRFGKDYPIPKRAMPKWLFWVVGPFLAKITRKYISRNTEHPFQFDNSKSVQALGQTYRPLQTTIEEMFEQMVERGVFR